MSSIHISMMIEASLYPHLCQALAPLGKGSRGEMLRLLATEGLEARLRAQGIKLPSQGISQVIAAAEESAVTAARPALVSNASPEPATTQADRERQSRTARSSASDAAAASMSDTVLRGAPRAV